MPHLEIARRHWRIGGDDIFIPLLSSAIGRLLWAILITLILYLDILQIIKCYNGIMLLIYLSITLLLFYFSIAIDFTAMAISLQGTPIEMNKRKKLGTFLTIRLIICALEILSAIFGIISILIEESFPCNLKIENSRVNKGIIGIIVFSQFIDSIFLFTCCSILSGKTIEESNEEHEIASEIHYWEERCTHFVKSVHLYGCNWFGGGNVNEGLENIAKLFTKTFHHEGFLDIVPSDVIAGIILVRNEQRSRRENAKRVFERAEGENEQYNLFQIALLPNGILRDIEQNEFEKDIDTRSQIKSFSRSSLFAMIIYNYIFPLKNETQIECCDFITCGKIKRRSLGLHLNYCFWYGNRVKNKNNIDEIEPIRFCGINRIGFSVTFEEFQFCEIIFLSSRNDMIHKPYIVLLDHYDQNVVISIRGTVSIEDCITDMACEPCEMTEVGDKWGFDGRNRWAHSGMLRAASAIRTELEYLGLLDRIFNLGFESEHPKKYGHYGLIVTGHSLGAGAAIILTMLLKEKYGKVICHAFGTPGSVLDKQTSLDVKEYVTSIILGNDMISRMSLRSLTKLRNDILYAIARAKVNKLYIMQALFSDIDIRNLLYFPGQEPDSNFKIFYEKFKKDSESRLTEMIELFLPGKIIHLVKSKINLSIFSREAIYALINGNLEDYTEIAVSRSMVFDHFPDQYYLQLKKLSKV